MRPAISLALAIVHCALIASLAQAVVPLCVFDKDVHPNPVPYVGPPAPKPQDWLFVNPDPGLSQTCIYNTANPVTINVDITRFIGDKVRLQEQGHADPVATIYLSVFDIDSGVESQTYSPEPCDPRPYHFEEDKVSVNGHVLPDSILHIPTNCIWGVAALPCSLSWLKFPSDPGDGHSPTPAHNEIKIAIDSRNAQPVWCTSIKWAAICCHVSLPIVMLHGGNSNPSTWDNLWAPHYRDQGGLPISTPTLPFIAGSAFSNRALVSAAVGGLRTRCGTKHVNLVGHCKGGIDARCMDWMEPGQVARSHFKTTRSVINAQAM